MQCENVHKNYKLKFVVIRKAKNAITQGYQSKVHSLSLLQPETNENGNTENWFYKHPIQEIQVFLKVR